eukprot:716388-Amphidinium_carterae.1
MTIMRSSQITKITITIFRTCSFGSYGQESESLICASRKESDLETVDNQSQCGEALYMEQESLPTIPP